MSRPVPLTRDPLVLDRVPLSATTFQALRDLLHNHSGIALAGHKLTMVQSRLAKRLRILGLRTYEDYLEKISDPDSAEWSEFINALTTNLTSFFREGHHFTRLVDLLKPAFEASRPLRIWSAGCSTGEEPYTVAMTLLKAFGPTADIRILATDLDTAVLATASRGVYPEARIEDLADEWKRLAFLRGKGEQKGLVRVRPEVRRLITFEQMNLLESRWSVNGGPFQAIFCRNVMIYFDKPTQKALLGRYHNLLEPNGHLFVGHSEALLDTTLGFQSIGQTIYRRKEMGSMSPGVPLVHGRASKYLDRHFNRQAMKILPGEFYATREDEVIVTVLGSCVAACLMDPIAMVGGMNHFMLPIKRGDRDPDVFYAARYGAAAMEFLINNLLHLGAQRDRLVAKAFGGGRVMAGMTTDVGGQNIEFVRQFLRSENIPIWSEDMGGPHPRKVYFFPHTGQVLVKRMERTHNDTLINREMNYLKEFTKSAMEGDVELFT